MKSFARSVEPFVVAHESVEASGPGEASFGQAHGLELHLKDRTPHLDAVFQKHPAIEELMTKLERILHELWLQEFVWPSIEVFAPIYDLICDLMSQCGLVFVRHKDEWRVVMYEKREAIEEARKALQRWTNPPEPRDD